jgi:hypothetical protein
MSQNSTVTYTNDAGETEVIECSSTEAAEGIAEQLEDSGYPATVES